MLKRFTQMALVATIALSVVALPFVVTSKTYAAIDQGSKDAACQGLGSAGSDCNTGNAKSTVDGLIQTVIRILSWVVGVVAIIMIIIGGFKYITSNGDANSVTSAKNTIMYALIGLALAAIAQVLVRFVLSETTFIHNIQTTAIVRSLF